MKDKDIPIKRIDEKVELMVLDNKIEEQKVFLTCGQQGCKEKTAIQLKLPDKMNGLNVDKIFPVCRNHLKKLYNEGFFDNIKSINHLKMIEGIIKYGSLKEWLDKLKKEMEDK